MVAASKDRVGYFSILACSALAALTLSIVIYGQFATPAIHQQPVAARINLFAPPMMLLLIAGDAWIITQCRTMGRTPWRWQTALLIIVGISCFFVVSTASAWNFPLLAAWGPALMAAGCLCFGVKAWLQLSPAAAAR